MFTSPGSGGAAGPQGYATLLSAILLHFVPISMEERARSKFLRLPPVLQAVLMCGLAYSLVVLAAAPRPFVYFEF
jgi:hypothetical protein